MDGQMYVLEDKKGAKEQEKNCCAEK
jgi:hypothetical protein